ncbi:MAG TPA: outer membrane beta-barrel protein [Terracidiphilus sp.]|nr:outer membrane beta-barrel protein [Terracidiphilus sp.]
MYLKWNRILQSMAGAFMAIAMMAGAQTPAPPASAPAASQAPEPAAAQPAAAAAAAPSPIPTPSVTGPLQWLPPATFSAGFLGKVAANGIVTGSGLWQGNHIPGDNTGQAALSNGQIFLQKADGPVQYFIEVGAYTLPSLGTPFLAADKTVSDFYGPVPVAFLKIPAGKTTSFQIGALPTLMGAEYTFTFENMNIERGLLWNQENAINRGIQVNQTLGKYFSASLSWNDGYYSNRYSWLTGLLTFTKGPHSIAFSGMGNLGQTAYQTTATPVQNNSTMYALIYTYTKGNWIVQPYWQYSDVPTNPAVGVVKGATTNGGAILLSRAFKHGFSLPARFEYITSSGSAAENSVNLLYGPGSSAVSGTVTPTYQSGGFYIRGDLSWVHANSYTPGDVFGSKGTNSEQPRAMAEIGFIFGNNLTER